MDKRIQYYGGQAITDKVLLAEIQAVEKEEENDFDAATLSLEGPLQCTFQDHTCSLNLGDSLGEGGEGGVFETDVKGLVAKIYWPKMRTPMRQEKLTFMVNHPLKDNHICWPQGILTYKSEFVGFVMARVDQKIYQKMDPDLGWSAMEAFFKNKKNALKALINIMHIFEKLREYPLVMGDINFDNFVIHKSNYSVILIDLDGAQIDKYPCLTCKHYFNAPELFKNVTDIEADEEHIANDYYHKIYSTFSRDDFGLAVYIFYILMCTKPYNNILDLASYHFGYDCVNENETLKHYKANAYSCRWSHLPYFMREAFYTSFTSLDPSDRLSPSGWAHLLTYYLSLLDNNQLLTLDSHCLELYPQEPLSYARLMNVRIKKTIQAYGFTLSSAIKSLNKSLKAHGVTTEVDSPLVAEYLKYKPELKTEDMTFKLLLNIGVLKKVAVEYSTLNTNVEYE